MPTFDIHRHGRQYAPEFPPDGHSDHLPMAWLALGGLGAASVERQAFAAAYLPRLEPFADGAPEPGRIDELCARLGRDGIPAVLASELPRHVSGWYREAYHPLLRLAYGVEFDVVEEVAAGLAYLERVGASERLAELARGATPAPGGSALSLFRQAAAAGIDVSANDSFSGRAEAVLAAPQMTDLARTVDDDLRAFSAAARAAFAATHDFFALHLVTGSHAFRILRPWAGEHADAVFNLGLLTGYLAIGAPPFEPDPEPVAAPTPDPGELRAACRIDSAIDPEHRIKLAWACRQLAGYWQDPAYLSAASGFLARV